MAIYVPTIKRYDPFYIQRSGDAAAIDVQTQWGITIKDSGYPMQRKVKTPYKNDWHDRDGDDEWNNVLNYEAFTYTLECVIFTQANDSDTSRAELKNAVRAFENAIKNGEFSIYSGWHKFGFRKCRVEEFPDPGSAGFSNKDGHCRLIFRLVLKINDPTTEMVLSGGKIVEA